MEYIEMSLRKKFAKQVMDNPKAVEEIIQGGLVLASIGAIVGGTVGYGFDKPGGFSEVFKVAAIGAVALPSMFAALTATFLLGKKVTEATTDYVLEKAKFIAGTERNKADVPTRPEMIVEDW